MALVYGLLWGATYSTLSESVSDYAVRVSAAVQTNPPRISLSWPSDPGATGYTLYRKSRDATDWGNGTVLAANATNYVDTTVSLGTGYEYDVSKSASTYWGDGYIYAGIEMPMVEARGKVILLVENTYIVSLSNELARLQQNLVGDGWTVLRHDVPRMAVDPANTSSNVWAARSNEIATLKTIIKADYNADPANTKTVFLFGHLAVPYSGTLAPDGHPEHSGAWPADAYYGDMNWTWTDSSVTDTAGSSRNRNVPGDGKFDQKQLPSDVELQVGRVDFANLPAFSLNETELLRRYLNKDHDFRHKFITAERRGLIDDHFGLSTGEPFAANGWRNFAAFFGTGNTFTGDWLTTLGTQTYLWGYGCGPGTYTGASGIATTAQLATNDPRVVFTMLFGSWFGDWDSQDNFLRAQLATTNYTLTSAWVGRPNWIFHHMALGETIGFSTRLTQNNNGSIYSAGGFAHYVHIALMGDPTLRMHIVAPPTNLVATLNGSGGVDLSWNPSPEAVAGYHVYRAATAAGPFTRLNTTLLTGTNYTDSTAASNTYTVRAVKLELSGSGSYWNASQGIFCNFVPLPVLTITAQSTNKVYGAPLPTFTATYSGFVNGDTTNSLDSQAVLSTTATNESPVGAYSITASGASSSNYTIVYVPGTLTITPAVTSGFLTSSTNPALPGEQVTFTLTLSAVAPGASTPTGSVQFKFDGTNTGGPISLSGGVAGFSTTSLAHGAHTVAAEYAGDGNFSGTTNLLSPNQVINTAPVAGPDMIERDLTNGVKVSISTLLTNDLDPDGDLIIFLGVSATSTNGGTVLTNDNWIFYTPLPGFTSIDAFTYTIGDGYGASATGFVTVNIRVDTNPSPNLTITNLGNGSYQIRGDGIPGRTYRIQFSDELDHSNWQTMGPALADPSGIFVYTDSAGSAQRFYRSAYP